MIFSLFLFFLFTGFFSYFYFKKEIFSPSVILCLVYLVSVGCAIYNIDRWGVNLHFNTFIIFIIGTILFIGVSVIIDKYFKANDLQRNKTEFRQNNIIYFNRKINIDNYKIISIIIFDILILLVMIFFMYRFASKYGEVSSISNMLNIYRKFTSYASTENAFPFLLRQFLKVLQLSGFIFLFIFIKNLLCNSELEKKDFVYLIPIFFTAVQSLLVSERLRILQLTATGVFLYYFLWSQKNNWEKTFSYSFYIKIVGLFIILMLGFYFIRLFIGRTSNENLLVYLTRYAGGSIQLFDLFMQDPPISSNIWGKETFYYLNENLHQFGLLKSMYVIHLEFRESAGVVLGNVYTAYRRWIFDFGFYGAMILQVFLSIIYNLGYYFSKIKCTKNILGEFFLILYSYLIFTLFMHPIDSNFYRIVVCLGFILTTIEMFMLYYFLLYFNKNTFSEYVKKVLKMVSKNEK